MKKLSLFLIALLCSISINAQDNIRPLDCEIEVKHREIHAPTNVTAVAISDTEVELSWGAMVRNEECSDNDLQLNVSDLESGIYIIKVKTGNNEIIKRFIKK